MARQIKPIRNSYGDRGRLMSWIGQEKCGFWVCFQGFGMAVAIGLMDDWALCGEVMSEF